MKLTVTRTHIELIIGSVATFVTGAICVYASVAFVSIYEDFYGTNTVFPLVTRIALAGKIWCPILLGVALIVFLRQAPRPPHTRAPLAALMAINLLTLIFVSYGFFAPIAKTTFGMSKSQTTAPKTP